MVYNTKYICTYNLSDIFEDSDNIYENEKYFVREAIYRQDLLNILNMDEYNEEQMNHAVHELYEKVKDSNDIMDCANKLAGHFLSQDPELGLMILFAFDYLHFTHVCISEYLETGQITEKNIWNLRSIVF